MTGLEVFSSEARSEIAFWNKRFRSHPVAESFVCVTCVGEFGIELTRARNRGASEHKMARLVQEREHLCRGGIGRVNYNDRREFVWKRTAAHFFEVNPLHLKC